MASSETIHQELYLAPGKSEYKNMYKKKGIIVGILLGNLLELYDHAIFGIFSFTLVQLYFPAGSETAKMIYSYGMFAIGFIVRPVGGLIFGFCSNKFSKKTALSSSLILMAIS